MTGPGRWLRVRHRLRQRHFVVRTGAGAWSGVSAGSSGSFGGRCLGLGTLTPAFRRGGGPVGAAARSPKADSLQQGLTIGP